MYRGRNLILISGKACSGKDTLALGIMEADRRYVRVAFADALKADVALRHGLTVPQLEARKGEFRKELQEYGQEQRQVDPSYWVNRLMEYVDDMDFTHVVVPDCRHLNELEIPSDVGFDTLTVRLQIPEMLQAMRYRDLYGCDMDEERRAHISETGLDDYFGWDVMLHAGVPTDVQVRLIAEYANRRGFEFAPIKEVAA